MRSAFAGIALAALAASTARAQRIRGTLTDSITREAISGAVVVLFDSAGRNLSRSIADARGKYSVPRYPGTRTMRVVGIGFRPREVSVGVADSLVDLRLEPVSALLGGVQSVENRVCAGEPTGRAALDLWEQARAGLLASVVSREAAPPRIRLRTYRRTLDPVLRRSVADTTDYRDVVDSRSFVAARSAWLFAAYGYMREESDGTREYFGPDESVLLDPEFVATHCLHAIDGPGPRSSQIGIAFDPIITADRDTIVDITGAVWLDRATYAPRAIEFRYTNLEREGPDAGGEVEFAVMPNGISMIDRWQIRSMVMALDVPDSKGLARRTVPRRERQTVRILGYRQIGGQIASAVWPDGKRWMSNLAHIQGTVIDLNSASVPGAIVWLVGLPDTVRADSLGRFAFPPMIPGLYTVTASDSALALEGIGRALPTRAVLLAIDNTDVELRYYPRSDVLPSICPAKSYRPGTGVLLAHVLDERGTPVPNARVEVETAKDAGSPDAPAQASGVRTGTAGDDGRFVICGAERDRRLIVRAFTDDTGAGIAVNRWGDDVLSVSLTLRPLKKP